MHESAETGSKLVLAAPNHASAWAADASSAVRFASNFASALTSADAPKGALASSPNLLLVVAAAAAASETVATLVAVAVLIFDLPPAIALLSHGIDIGYIFTYYQSIV